MRNQVIAWFSLILVIMLPANAWAAETRDSGQILKEEPVSEETGSAGSSSRPGEPPKLISPPTPGEGPAPPASVEREPLPPLNNPAEPTAVTQPPVTPETPEPKKDDQKPQMPQMPNQQDKAPMKPEDPMSKEFQCEDPPPIPPKCKAGCGYDNCIFKFNKEQGPDNCKQATDYKIKCDIDTADCMKLPPGPNCIKKAEDCAQYQSYKLKCCKAHALSELAQITTQADPCNSAANLKSGGALTPAEMILCLENSLNRCPVVDKKQLAELKQRKDYIESLGNNPNDIKSATNLLKDGGKYGTMFDKLKGNAFADMVKGMGPQIASMFKGGGSGSDQNGFQTSSGGEEYQVGNNIYTTKQLQNGDNLLVNQADGSNTVQDVNGNKLSVLERNSAVPVYLSSSEGMRMASSTSDGGGFSVAANKAIVESLDYGMNVWPEAPASSITPRINEDSLTGAIIVGNVPYYAVVRFFPGVPRMANLGEIHAGLIADDWVKVIPRANAKINFKGKSSYVTSLSQGMGIPRGSSLMVLPQNLGVISVLNYMIDGLRDYDYILSGGRVIWTLSGTPGGKIIASSFGIPPDEYLSNQQRAMVYG